MRALWGVFGHVLGEAWQVDFVAMYAVRALWGVFGHVADFVAIYAVRALWGVFGQVLGEAWQANFVAI